MTTQTKTDNSSLASKLAVRRYFLRRYHGAGPFGVLDCCEGSGVMWSILGREFDASVWGIDLKRQWGRLRVDSRRILASPDLEADVIDVDVYGSPWKHWLALLGSRPRPLTVFLTWGLVRVMGGGSSPVEREVLGLKFPSLDVPSVLVNSEAVAALIAPRMFVIPEAQGWKVVEVKESPRGRTARYFGVRLEAGTPE
jgi:hypothetical protein